MTSTTNVQSWNVGRAGAACHACAAALPPGAACSAALCDRPLALVPERTDEPKGKKTEETAPPSPFVRIDFCEKCWEQGKRPSGIGAENRAATAAAVMFSFWKTAVPTPEHKKKLLVDDSVLVDVFGRMEGKTEPQEVRFRFVLALILMRKRLLKYDGMESVREEISQAAGSAPEGAATPPGAGEAAAAEIWRMIPRGQEIPVRVINPHLTAEQIVEVSQQLSAILAEEI